jgi:hydroxymethylpyrimidine/phosphomethylpyrimidine kinase
LQQFASLASDGDDNDERDDDGFDEEGDDDEVPVSNGMVDDAVTRLLGMGAEYVLMTGAGDHGPQLVNILYGAEGVVRTDAWERLPGQYLGARSTLGAALAAALAHGMDVPEAAREAQEFTWQALSGAYRPGMGLALPDRFFWARTADEDAE